MKTDVAFDSNILLYLPGDEDEKADGAAALLSAGGIVTPLVLLEVSRVARKKWRWEWPAIDELVGTIRANTLCLPLSCEAHARGSRYAARYQLQIPGALHVASAVIAGCTTLWSEDMHHGLKIDGLTIRNPFRA